MIIHMEITRLNEMNTQRLSSRERMFSDYNEFRRYYIIALNEKNSIINIKFYNPLTTPELAAKFDYMLYNSNGDKLCV